MKDNKLGQLIIGLMIVTILISFVLPFGFNYYMTKYRLEKIYKVENPSFIHVLWEIGRK